jgi:hypothetical protein
MEKTNLLSAQVHFCGRCKKNILLENVANQAFDVIYFFSYTIFVLRSPMGVSMVDSITRLPLSKE